jgi:Concanavalin A-like lectin/glucanases superfamily
MEYLMTYGWTILIIAVVLGTMFQLGVFNSSSFATKAQPGSCKVVRPDGPGTATFINLEGICIDQLPQFVGSFDGVGSYANMGAPSILNPSNTPWTRSMWVDEFASPPSNGAYLSTTGWQYNYGYMILVAGSSNCGGCNGNVMVESQEGSGGNRQFTLVSNGIVPPNMWNFIAVTWDSTYYRIYINGALDSASASFAGFVAPSYYNIQFGRGRLWGTNNYQYGFQGLISNVQIYNASFDARQIQTLYAEGIGGAPISLQYLVGWWPLNKNATDYSGNNNNGAATNVIFTSSWTK